MVLFEEENLFMLMLHNDFLIHLSLLKHIIFKHINITRIDSIKVVLQKTMLSEAQYTTNNDKEHKLLHRFQRPLLTLN